MAGTAKPMKMPSGQVIWVRVDDDDDEHAGPEDSMPTMPAPYAGPPPGGPAPGYGYTPPPPPPPPPGAGYGTPPGAPPQPAPPPYPYPADQGYPRPGWRKRRGPKPIESADSAQQLQGFTEAVSGIADSVRESLKHAAPDSVEIEFGLDIDVSSGVAVSLIADARAKAAVRITLGWDNAARRERSEIDAAPQRAEERAEDSATVIRPGYAWSDAVPELPAAVSPPYGPSSGS